VKRSLAVTTAGTTLPASILKMGIPALNILQVKGRGLQARDPQAKVKPRVRRSLLLM
jgi:hypothetical protein